VRFLGYVPRPALVALYNLAEALVLPSVYEGFGLPLVEAFACGTPVICSTGGSLPEIAGQGADLFDPLDPKELLAMLAGVVDDPKRREELRLRSVARARDFSWERAARETRAVYELAFGHALARSQTA
jgi:alpha-1,3-rhamnosyl/mannosyltransferase